jgi:excisionase family DNA binding protein
MERTVISVAEASRVSDLSVPTLYRFFNAGKLETVKVGGRRLVKIDSLQRLLSPEGGASK